MKRLQPNYFLIGPMAAGKTTIGRFLSRELQLEFYDSDHEVEKRAGVTVAWIFDVEGEEGFRKREEKVIEEITQLQGIVLSTGGGAILSSANRAFLAARGTVIYLQLSLEQQLNRTRKDRSRPLLQGVQLEQRLKELAKVREPLYQELADWVVPTDGGNPQVAVKQILRLIEEQKNPL